MTEARDAAHQEMIRLCINCNTVNSAEAVFCSECGMSLTRATIGEVTIQHPKEREEAMENASLFTISDIWYATQVDNRWNKVGHHDDAGHLEAYQDRIVFKGKRFVVEIGAARIVGLDLTRQVFPWANMLVLVGIALLTLLFIILDPVYTENRSCLNLVLISWLAVPVLITWALLAGKWVRIQYEDEDEDEGHWLTEAYLCHATPGSSLLDWDGTAPLFRSTKKMHEQLNSWLRAYHLHVTKP